MKIQFNAGDLTDTVRRIVQVLQGRVALGTATNPESKNADVDPTVSLVIAAANTNTVTAHQLGRVPDLYLVTGATAAGSVYDSSVGRANWTATEIELRASATGTYRLMIA